jgi:tetratricopeptide (TPR) repeat protein
MKNTRKRNFEATVQGLRSTALHIFLAAIVTLASVGCSKKARQASLQARADGYFKAGEYDKAKIEYMNLLRADNSNASAWQQIGVIWFEQGAPLQAFPFLRKSRELAPGNLDLRLKLASAFMSMGQFDEARKEAIAILAQAPSNDEALMLLAETARTQEDVDYTLQQLEKNKEPDRAAIHLASAVLSSRKREPAAAEQHLQKALALDPKSVPAHLAMANVFLAKKDLARAGEELKAAADLSPPRAVARLKLAEFKLNSGAADEAKALLKEMTQKTPDYLPAWRLQAQIAFAEKKYGEALGLLENIFGRDTVNIEARMLQAQIWLAQREVRKAVEGMERLSRTYPKVPLILHQLAQAYLQDANPTQAAAVLKEAVAVSPDYLDSVFLLAEVNLRGGDAKAAVDSMLEVLKKRPSHMQAQMLLATAYQSLGQFDDAAGVFRAQITARPQNATSHFMLGAILRQKGSLPEARAAFEKVLELAPDNLLALYQLVDLDIVAKDFNAAHQKVQAQVQKKQDSSATQFLSGKIYAAERDWDRAEAALLKAIELDSNSASAYSLLISVYIEAGKLPEAVRQVEASLARNPDDQRGLLTAAMIYEKMKAFPKARDAYEKVLAKSPDFGPALNNLAVLYSEQLNQLDRAQELALKARTLRPDDPSVADTLGRVFFKRGDYKQALALIAESAAKIPDNPEIQYHLGMAHSMMGQTEAARTAFQAAVKAPGDFPGKEEAQRRLASIGGASGAPAELSIEEIEAKLKQHPEDILMSIRLGEAYEKQGAFPKAAAAYEDALRLNPKLLAANLNLARLNSGPLKNSAKALELAKKAREIAPNDTKAMDILGRVSYQTGNFPVAYNLLQQSARQPAADPDLLHDFAWAAYNMGNVTQARNTMQRLLNDAPNSPNSDDAKSFLAMTALEDNSKELATAEPEVQKLLASNPSYLPAQMARAALQMSQGDTKTAGAAYAEILGRYPDFAPAQKRLASIYLTDPANRDKAYGIAVKARKALPEDSRLAEILGELSFHRKEYANAIQFFQESAKKQPLGAISLYYLGNSQFQARQLPAARESLEKALAAGLTEPLLAEANRLLAELNK